MEAQNWIELFTRVVSIKQKFMAVKVYQLFWACVPGPNVNGFFLVVIALLFLMAQLFFHPLNFYEVEQLISKWDLIQ